MLANRGGEAVGGFGGGLNGGKTAISTLAFAQDFDLDQLNNWATFTEDTDGDTTLDLD